MNNIPSQNAPAIIRSLIIYAVCVPLAIFIGYLLTNPIDYSTLGFLGILALVLLFPLLLRWHHPVLLLSWNASAVMFFLKGSPSFWMVMVVLSVTISVLERILVPDRQFIRVPQLTWPLLVMFAVVVGTAKLTGGFGFKAFGSEVYGGKKYLLTLVGILSYFALTARKIPPSQVRLALALFFLGGITYGIGDLISVIPSPFRFIFWIFPPTSLYTGMEIGTTRLNGVQFVSTGLFCYMMARYGIRGIFSLSRPWRLMLFFLFSGIGLLGGYRGVYIAMAGTFAFQFFLEGLHRTKLLPIFAFCGLLVMVVTVPLVSKLPFTVQRSLAFLPLPVDPLAKQNADSSVEWRMDLWRAMLPQIPKYLWLGKGYAITMEDFEFMGTDSAFRAVDPTQQGLAISSDYHSGWITVLITFGAWGMLAFLWFAFASLWVLYRNYRHGDPNLRIINCFLLANFATRFLTIMSFGGGGFHSDLAPLVGCVGLSVVFNGGVCGPAPQLVPESEAAGPGKFLPRRHPAFQRGFFPKI